MIYVATLLILIGMLFFIIASMGSEITSKSRKRKFNPMPRTQVVRNSPIASKKVLFNFRYPEYKSSTELEKRIRQERRMATSTPRTHFEEPNFDMPDLEDFPEEDSISSFYETVSTRTVNPYRETREKVETIPMEVEPDSFTIELNGLLFLDFSRSIPFQTKELKSIAWNEGMFQNFKRIGLARVQHKNKSFKLITGTLSHEYAFTDIQEVVFFEEAFSIIPKKGLMPTPLIFSEEVAKLKAVVARVTV